MEQLSFTPAAKQQPGEHDPPIDDQELVAEAVAIEEGFGEVAEQVVTIG